MPGRRSMPFADGTPEPHEYAATHGAIRSGRAVLGVVAHNCLTQPDRRTHMRDSQIADLLRPVLAEFDLELEAVEVIPAGKRRLLRIVVDGDGPHGAGPLLDNIAEASNALSAALDRADVAGSSPYTLEVSSRGVTRPLVQPRHWRRNLGRLVEVTLNGGELFTGRVVSTTSDTAVLDVEQAQRTVRFTDVETAFVQVELNRPVGKED